MRGTDVSVGDERVAGMHDVLLGLAGRVPDEFLATVRQQLAEGGIGQVAESVCQELAAGGVALSFREMGVLAELLPGSAISTFSRIPIGDEQRVLAWHFTGAPSEPVGVDDAGVAGLVAVLSGTAGARGLWCVWRGPVSGRGPWLPVYVVEAGGGVDLVGLTGRLQRVLVVAGSGVPRVEVVVSGGEVPVYQRAARSYGRLVWAASEPVGLQLARVFDGVDEAGESVFEEDHPRLVDVVERDRVLDYLRAGTVVLDTDSTIDDVVDRSRGSVVPMSFRSDGVWIWPDIVCYYLEQYGLAPDEQLLAHIRDADRPPAPLDAVAVHRVLEYLSRPQDA
ncbi:hypothetical protein [Saccharopolyspora spinosa]|uniref:Uncharacterized protein n=1 Tax=Saccharopolyspora spinosa TaxID=60894 RepID=A0A2N3Y590_SACSN|nr:hypothetical protein [Saccharopolyspora spinosa]PKW18064.1 hypothetical protein A8926_6119 [Saccharopolyspora spinosa]